MLATGLPREISDRGDEGGYCSFMQPGLVQNVSCDASAGHCKTKLRATPKV